MSVCRIVLLSLVFVIPTAYGQQEEHASIGTIVVNDAVTAFHDGIAYFTAPFRMDRKDALNLFKFGMVTTAAIASDRGAANGMRNIPHTNTLNTTMSVVREYGD